MTQGSDLLERTNDCGELGTEQVGAVVVLAGWVHRLRDHGGVIFLDLRDRAGITQLVLRSEEAPEPYRAAREIRVESVIGVHGRVEPRSEGNRNRSIPTGDIEVVVDRLEVLNPAEPLPFEVEGQVQAGEELRLTYRYLDLRRARYQETFRLRHRVALAVRRHLDREGFVEIETPALTKSTPEGSREYLVPSRVNPGTFYSLPQSPQLFKQILMVAGFDRYFQLARCYRDEDLRSDRQPEFTQIDMEMSFITVTKIFPIIEALIEEIFAVAGKSLHRPYPVLDYEEAMSRYGSDKPDMRFGMEIVDLTELAAASGWDLLQEGTGRGESVLGMVVEEQAGLSRKQIDQLAETGRERGLRRLFWLPWKEGGLTGGTAGKLGTEIARRMLERAGGRTGDGLLFVCEPRRNAQKGLGVLRLQLAESLDLRKGEAGRLLWVQNFPLFERDDATGALNACHHPFTAPRPEDLELLDDRPEAVRAQAYDLVLDGEEIGGGSIRIHRSDVQRRVFHALGISPEQAEQKFGFLLQALRYGAPPHGGIALGFDRIIAILIGAKSLREVIAFPKTSSALDLMTGSPSTVDPMQLRDLHIQLRRPRKSPPGPDSGDDGSV